MKNKVRKKLQRKINRHVRKFNKFLMWYDEFEGRFSVKQMNTDYCEYSDKSGGSLMATLEFFDKKTNCSSLRPYECYSGKTEWDMHCDLIALFNHFMFFDCGFRYKQ